MLLHSDDESNLAQKARPAQILLQILHNAPSCFARLPFAATCNLLAKVLLSSAILRRERSPSFG
eukprot:938224-Amphidinium_carterae.1